MVPWCLALRLRDVVNNFDRESEPRTAVSLTLPHAPRELDLSSLRSVHLVRTSEHTF